MTGANRVAEWFAKKGMKSTLLGIFVNLGLSVTKISAGMVGHSFALVADGLESGADVLSGLVVFFGLKIAASLQMQIIRTGTVRLNRLQRCVLGFRWSPPPLRSW